MHHADFTTLGSIAGSFPALRITPATTAVRARIDYIDRLMYGWIQTYVSGDASRFPTGLPKFVHVQRLTVGSG